MNVWFFLALADASDNPPGESVGNMIIEGVCEDARFDGPASALVYLSE